MQTFSIGILSWHSTDVLINTLKSYHDNGLIGHLCQDTTIYFQEMNADDIAIAQHFGVKYMGTKDNIGIGQAMIKLVQTAKNKKILLLEHDWELIENIKITEERISNALDLLDFGYDCVKLRHREKPGYPHFSIDKYRGRELEYVDPEIQLPYPHLLDSVHWLQYPDKDFPGKIGSQQFNNELYCVSTSRYSAFTNNPCMYNRDFYIKIVKPHMGGGIDLEGKISYHWARANYNCAHGYGLFKHNDFQKYSNAK